MKISHPQARHSRGAVLLAALAAVLVLLTVVSLVVTGFGENRTPAHELPPVLQQPVATAPDPTMPAGSTGSTLSLHARVMREQGRQTNMSASDGLRTTASTEPSRTTTTVSPSVAKPLEQDDAVEESVVDVILTEGQTPLRGVWTGTADRLASGLLGSCSSPRFTVPVATLAEYYIRYCGEAGLRADLLWAQMMHETGSGAYGRDVAPEQNNYAGIGATGDGQPGVWFTTAEAGVMAHVAHMVAYVYASSPVPWADANVDPRFDLVQPRGEVFVLADLNGRWAVPGTNYGERIEAIARAINAQ